MNEQLIPDLQELAVTNVIEVALKDKTALHANYMPFIRGGGLYAISDKPCKLGDSVVVSLTIDSVGKRLSISGDIVWTSPQDTNNPEGPQGVGVRFGGRQKDSVKKFLESVLGELASRPSVYHAY